MQAAAFAAPKASQYNKPPRMNVKRWGVFLPYCHGVDGKELFQVIGLQDSLFFDGRAMGMVSISGMCSSRRRFFAYLQEAVIEARHVAAALFERPFRKAALMQF